MSMINILKALNVFNCTGESIVHDESLAEHDKRFHPDGYDPETQSCGKRDRMEKSDDRIKPDELTAGRKRNAHRDYRSEWISQMEKDEFEAHVESASFNDFLKKLQVRHDNRMKAFSKMGKGVGGAPLRHKSPARYTSASLGLMEGAQIRLIDGTQGTFVGQANDVLKGFLSDSGVAWYISDPQIAYYKGMLDSDWHSFAVRS